LEGWLRQVIRWTREFFFGVNDKAVEHQEEV
jgi:hypothetical protein